MYLLQRLRQISLLVRRRPTTQAPAAAAKFPALHQRRLIHSIIIATIAPPSLHALSQLSSLPASRPRQLPTLLRSPAPPVASSAARPATPTPSPFPASRPYNSRSLPRRNSRSHQPARWPPTTSPTTRTSPPTAALPLRLVPLLKAATRGPPRFRPYVFHLCRETVSRAGCNPTAIVPAMRTHLA
jgi:hypothetical protein